MFIIINGKHNATLYEFGIVSCTNIPFSEVQCPEISVQNSNVTSAIRFKGDILTVECNLGFIASSGLRSFNAECKENGTWTEMDTCKSKLEN